MVKMNGMSKRQLTLPSLAIVGAGLAGLCLAQYLRRRGIEIQVYERDPGPLVRTQGHRITVDRHGLQALRESLLPKLYELAIATAGSSGGYFRFTNRRLRDAFKLSFPEAPDSERQMDRQVLRSVLLAELEQRVHFGAEAVSLDTSGERTRIRFAADPIVEADVVVVADGVGSRLREQVLPGSAPVESGIAGIYGRTPLLRGRGRLIPPGLERSGVLSVGDEPGRAVFFTSMEFGESPQRAFARLAPDAASPGAAGTDYVMWGVVARQDELPDAAEPEVLRGLAADLTTTFHPLIGRLIAAADEDATMATRFGVSPRPGVWAVPNTAVIGDAVHTMPPFGAHGGNTALRDAAVLGAALVEALTATPSSSAIASALAGYRQAMIPYAFAAVDAASAQMTRLTGTGGLQKWLMLNVMTIFSRKTVPTT
jgi:2-polyprenyl-6-methoxyphenol hydroxylase-like FAD-dependent oxidoreductase